MTRTIRLTLWVDVVIDDDARPAAEIAAAVADDVYAKIDQDRPWTIDDVTHAIDEESDQ